MIMAGAVRQPIDTTSLSNYIGEHIPEIELPVYIKQASLQIKMAFLSLKVLLSTTPVWLWAI